jgi:hypothetical protein
LHRSGGTPGLVQRWEQDPDQNCDDANDDEQFDQCKTV